MSRPRFEVADVLQRFGKSFYKSYPQSSHVCSTLNLIQKCRTSALKGHLDKCPDCGWSRPAYNSCRNRHCPKCQTMAKEEWIEDRQQELLPVPYFHCVFTLPHELNPLILQNKKVMLDLLFKTVNETLQTFAKDPKWKLQGELGFIAVLHTWTQKLTDHFHLHIVIPRGALRDDQFIHAKGNKFLFHVKAMSPVFAAKYRQHLKKVYDKGALEFHGRCKPLAQPAAFYDLINQTKEKEWNIFAKKPFGGPQHVLEYLGRYTHRVAISNHRITHISDTHVTFTTRNRETNTIIPECIPGKEFLRRFSLHILPKGYMKIRFFGFLCPTKKRESLKTIRAALNIEAPERPEYESLFAKMLRLTGQNIYACPHCQQVLEVHPLPELDEQTRAPP